MKRIVAFAIPLVFLASLFFPRCAVIVAPTGGPKDTIAPVMVKSVPLLHATNFKGEKIVINFDEYVKLDKISEKLVLSPPQERLPESRIRGKSLEIKFFEPLTDSTTYTLYFADAIRDNNENNPIDNFEFAFSTGSYIDSLRYTGRVIDAFTLEPQEGVFVMLYEEHADSVPIIKRPRYVTKTNKEGAFFLSNLKQNSYKIFALRDGNTNYLFDQMAEEIAFSNTIINEDMLVNPSQAAQADSLNTLRLFKEKSKVQSLTDYSRPQRRRIKLGFSQKPIGNVALSPIGYSLDSTETWFIPGLNVVGDSLNFWITNANMALDDSLRMEVKYLKSDSLMNLVPQADTLRLFYSETPQQQTGRKGKKDKDKEDNTEEKTPTQKVKSSVRTGDNVIPNQSLALLFSMPQQKVDTSLINLFNSTDSIALSLPTIAKDSLDPRVYSFTYNWENLVNYQLTAFPGAFVNLDGVANDTVTFNFRGANPEMSGIINLTLQGVTPNVVAHLLGGKDEIIDQKTVESDGMISFTYVKPGKYKLRFIVDENLNGKWDTGLYLEGKQPERVIFYKDATNNQEIQVRANWEYDISFNLKR